MLILVLAYFSFERTEWDTRIMRKIIALRSDLAFEPDDITLMAGVYDRVLSDLGTQENTELAHEVASKAIIEMAQRGERDPGRLYEAALAALRTH